MPLGPVGCPRLQQVAADPDEHREDDRDRVDGQRVIALVLELTVRPRDALG